MLRGRYGRATEKLLGDPPADQQIIDEIEAFLTGERATTGDNAQTPPYASVVPATAPTVPPTAPAAEAPATAQRGHRQRPSQTFPQLEVRTQRVDLSGAERKDADGRPMVACGCETVETVVFTPPEVFIQQTI